MKFETLPITILFALYDCKVEFGSRAKAKIREAWMTGDYSTFPSNIQTNYIAQFRNIVNGGPSALQSLNFVGLFKYVAQIGGRHL